MSWVHKHPHLFILAVILLVGIWRVTSMYAEYSHTTDESAHLAAGLQWWGHGEYTTEVMHPPLGRIAIAALPFFDGLRLKADPVVCKQSFMAHYRDIAAHHDKGFYHSNCADGFERDILFHGDYDRNLTLARLGVLPFFILLILYSYRLGAALAGKWVGVTAAGLLSFLPAVLAHSALATTDIPFAATYIAAVFYLQHWYRNRGTKPALQCGIATAYCLLTKLSALLYLPVAGLLCILLFPWPKGQVRALLKQAALIIGVAFAIIWAAYFFSIGKPAEVIPAFAESTGGIAHASIIPVPEFWQGIFAAAQKNEKGHAWYLLGEALDQQGVWYFFPVVLFFKTPLAFWGLCVLGLVAMKRQPFRVWLAPALALAILLCSMPVNINIGVRHILFITPFLAIMAAISACHPREGGDPVFPLRLDSRLRGNDKRGGWRLAAGVLLLLLYTVESGHDHPDYLPYFNALAGDHPERIAVDSDLDWLQDDKKLLAFMRERGVKSFTLCHFGQPFFDYYGFSENRYDCPTQKPEGWFVVRTNFAVIYGKPKLQWLAEYKPTATIGHTLRIYDFTK